VTPKVPAAGEASQPPPDQHGIQPNNYPAAFVDVGDSDDEDYEDDEDDGFWWKNVGLNLSRVCVCGVKVGLVSRVTGVTGNLK
jgi:hypothetical protein